MEFLLGHINVFVYVILMMVGFYAMLAKKNLVKKVIGMNVFQWSLILFVVSLGSKRGANIPIVQGFHHGHTEGLVIEAAKYINPLPHVLMLTAIVVGVATTSVALALMLRIYKTYGTLEEDEILKKLK
jgi:multicomponent Na+:H+ antiporter subunit C